LISVLSAVVLVVVAAAALLVVRPGPVAGWLAAAPTPTPNAVVDPPEPTPPPVLQAAGTGGGAPTAAGVKSAIGALLDAAVLGKQVNISVVDAATGETLYAANPDTLTTPASTTKLITAAAVLKARGPAYRLTTRVVAGAKPGEVVVIGGGDPTMAVDGNALFPGAARLDRLAGQVKKALGGVRPTHVVIDGSLFSGPTSGPGWSPGDITDGQTAKVQAFMTNGGRRKPVHHEVGGDPRFTDPALSAGQAFAKALGVPTSAVSTGRAPASPTATGASQPAADPSAAGAAAQPGAELGRVDSPPLIRIVDWMLQFSDNVLAEALARQVALAADQPASFAGAAAALEAAVTGLGLPADESNLSDGSGLSRDNRVTPSFLTDLLKLAADGSRPELSGLFGGLPVAGWSGTLRTRFATPAPNRDAQGLVRAKTGTLSGVNALSGELVTRDGRLLVFAIMADKTSGDTDAVRTALDQIAAKLVACGCG
jgi:D-alanyl-D-alanine carboxypeptidase/D-alanyl-D-alanine-endopeptidase (penicillin-binding protein 4)